LDDPARIFFGAWMQLEDEHGTVVVYRIVGPDEFDPAKGWISIDSPLARALLKKTAGDDVRVVLPRGEMEYYVVAVRYTPFEK
jgi:transcription elongation factor GreB